MSCENKCVLSGEVIDYILSFLLGDLTNSGIRIKYTDNVDDSSSDVIIVASNFIREDVFGSRKSLPQLPLADFMGVPLLFGSPEVAEVNGKLIIYADLVASTYFLISRYEETVNLESRDRFGRFSSDSSVLGRAGVLNQPLADMYGNALRELLRERFNPPSVTTPPAFSSISLTHDVDAPWEYFSLLSGTKRILGNLKRDRTFNLYPVKSALGWPEDDPRYTFPDMIKMDASVVNAKKIYFIKSGGNAIPYDSHTYINSSAFKRLHKKMLNSGAEIGFHPSYECGADMSLFGDELAVLEERVGEKIHLCRHHYLNSRKPSDYRVMIKCGITDDYSMGFADSRAFRLGTTRCVRWIDPEAGCLTPLVLHPLTIMDTTLFGYNRLPFQDAVERCKELVDTVRNNNGDLCLLWHNNSADFEENNLFDSVYALALEAIRETQKKLPQENDAVIGANF